MVKLAKKLKKNNVAVDVVCYGDGIEELTEDNKSVLKAFVESASSGDNSYVIILAFVSILTTFIAISFQYHLADICSQML